MILIFGGAYQGKLAYALDNYINTDSVFKCQEDCITIDFSKEIITEFHILVLSHIRNDVDTQTFIEQHGHSLKSKIVICDDISSGVVPISAETRAWREAVGRNLVLLSQKSDEVVRVFCGLGMKLK